MVNVEEFAKRLNLLMDYYELTAALLAEKIDVQRSSISHILSGRNKPSLEFVLKILKTFPEVELYWLLNGTGSFPKQSEKSNSTPTPPTLFNQQPEKVIEKIDTPKNIDKNIEEIDRIVIFFKDGSFKNYTP